MTHPAFAGTFLLVALAVHHTLASAQTDGAHTITVNGQFVLALPSGWAIYDQTEVVSGGTGSHGLIIFAALPLPGPGEIAADSEVLKLVDTGELPSFFVDRKPVTQGISCKKFSKTDAYWLGTELKKDSIFGLSGVFFNLTPPKHSRITIGGCEAWRYEGNPKEWVMDVRAVSDGEVLYLFSLRNKRSFYDANLPIFDAAIASVQFVGAPSPTLAPPNNALEQTSGR